MPPLREHSEDIPQIAWALLDRMDETIKLSPDALSRMMVQRWPGNVRELSNTLERATARAVATRGSESDEEILKVGVEHLDVSPAGFADLPFKDAKARVADEWAKATIQSTLIRNNGNATHAAQELKMSRTALLRLIKKYNISRE
jgi:DNA-binding NtrC family response regulator